MIATKQTIAIDASLTDVWSFAKDIGEWARLMPGLQDYIIISDDDSRWTLKVGAGALVRTIKVFVHVVRWAGPDEVDFSFILEGDPVKGSGTYRARDLEPSNTEVNLAVHIEGAGPMAPMWEALGKPLLPKFARGFAEQFKAEVERTASAGDAIGELKPSVLHATGSIFARLLARLRALFAFQLETKLK